MNLRGAVNAITQTVNPNIVVLVQISDGYTIGAGQRQAPTYKPAISGPAQIQALSSSDLKKIEGLNIQGSMRALYMYGNLNGVVRADSQGGDLITVIAQRGVPPTLVGKWLTAGVPEPWTHWTKIMMVKQTDAVASAVSFRAVLSVTSPNGGNFTVPHGLPSAPKSVRILMTNAGGIWQAAPPDATNVYLAASDTGVTANVTVRV